LNRTLNNPLSPTRNETDASAIQTPEYMNPLFNNVRKPNLLFLVHRFPFPPNRGDRIRSFHMLKFLSQHFSIYLATLCDEKPQANELEVVNRLCAGVIMSPIGRYSRWIRAAGRVASGYSATQGLFESPSLRRHIRRWTSTIRFDAGLVFCSSMMQYIDRSLRIPIVVDLVDVDSQKWLDYAEQASGWKRLLFQLESRRLRQLELSLPERCQAITLVSQAEADVYRRFCPNTKTSSIGNGVELDYFRPSESPTKTTPNLECVFVGALDYRANVQAIEWFCRNCWPSIKRKNQHAILSLVGRNPVSSVISLANIPGVKLVGQVPDVRPYLHRSAIAIAPLLVARGIQNKILEAMATGMPVVASSQAIQGLGCEIDKHLLQADTPQDWIETISTLLGDAEKRRGLGLAAREFVESHHCWSAHLEGLLPLFGKQFMGESPVTSRTTAFDDATASRMEKAS
jgi:sugar transferase (PEP-CTERM/EpsH1 system associated)